jgi:SAM-dependent methyltransferase
MIKPWSTKEVAESHGYLSMSQKDDPHHREFADWLNNQTQFSRTVVDIGCCSGKVLNHIGGIVDQYLGIDFSESSVDFALANRTTAIHKFVCMDAETDPLPFQTKEYSICYIDSVITMVHSPTRLLFKLAPYFDCIFLNRTPVCEETNKGSMLWGGMSSPSVLWSFSIDYFRMIASEMEFGFVEISPENKIVIIKRH